MVLCYCNEECQRQGQILSIVSIVKSDNILRVKARYMMLQTGHKSCAYTIVLTAVN